MDFWEGVAGARLIGETPPAMTGLTHDSRRAGPESAFIAVPGDRTDGHGYIDAAVAAGVPLVVVEEGHETQWSRFVGHIPLVVVPDSRAAMGPLASAIHGHPTRRLRVIGITGTDGKTTTSYLTAHVLDRCGFAAGYLTSAGFDLGLGREPNESHMTTIEATLLQAQLGRAVATGRRSMVVEASSEGLAQHRLDGCEVDVAVFTNLTRDHLDFHGTMEAYLAAKGILFEMLRLPSEKTFPRAAVINTDDPAAPYIKGRSNARVITYGLSAGADIQGRDIETAEGHLRFRVIMEDEEALVTAPLLGRFNVYNCLAAIGVATSQGAALASAAEALGSFTGVPGRLELVDCGQPFRVYIDIASTPAALENTLNALRPATSGRLWAVFGVAGGRDPARRDGMGRVAARLADRVILTNEDPRDEEPDAIIETIASGLREGGRVEDTDFERLPNRREAIARAFAQAKPGDTVLLAGKANETSMIFESGRQEPWDERAVAEALLGG